MRISDWSSDVCSSDLPPKARRSFPDNTGYSMASTARFDVAAIGNAIVDVIARTDDALIEAEGLVKGSMRLIDAPEATRLYAAMGQIGRASCREGVCQYV